MEWAQSQFIYNVTTAIMDRSIEALFNMVGGISAAFSTPLTAAAAIYIALVGYGVMSGAISMSLRDLAIRFAKVVAILVIVGAFQRFGNDLFEAVWDIPEGIAEYLVVQTAPILQLPPGTTALLTGDIAALLSGSPDTLDELSGMYSGLASLLGDRVAQVSTASGEEDTTKAFFVWIISMVPLGITLIGIYLAKFVTALLFLVSPVVFILSLVMDGFRGNAIFLAWCKGVIMSLLTVVIVYTVGVICMVMMTKYMGALLAAEFLSNFSLSSIITFFTGGGGEGFQYTIVQLSPLAIIALFSVILISQATTVASSLFGIAAIGTQQATSFMQIGALQAASRSGAGGAV